MSESNKDRDSESVVGSTFGSGISRKNFLKYAGASAVAASTFGLVSCNDDEVPGGGDNTVNLGSGNLGILNFAYALEQLEAAFYIKVADSFYANISPEETTILNDIRDHEVTHRDFFKAAISGAAPNGIIPDLNFDFSAVDFNSRASVLGTAKTFEDVGVSAYNGQGGFIDSSSDSGLLYLLTAGKIVSVEARHAAAIRDLLNPKSGDFAGDDVVDANGLDMLRTSADVRDAAGGFIMEDIDISGLPDQQ